MSFTKINLSELTQQSPLVCQSNIVLVTGNPNKADEISKILNSLNVNESAPIKIGILPIDLIEIQGSLGKDYQSVTKEVTMDKIKQCWNEIRRLVTIGHIIIPAKTLFIIEDSSFFLLAHEFNFPGHLVKGVTPQTLIDVVDGMELRRLKECTVHVHDTLENAKLSSSIVITNENDIGIRSARAVSQFACFAFDPIKLAEYTDTLTEDKIVFIEGQCEGNIGRSLTGNGGFAWDHCFVPNEKTLSRLGKDVKDWKDFRKRSFSEMIDLNADAKNKVSQRFDATLKLHPVICGFVESCV